MKSDRAIRTNVAYPPIDDGTWWTTPSWHWDQSEKRDWYLCPAILQDERGREGPPGLIGGEVEWRSARRTAVHRELAELRADAGERALAGRGDSTFDEAVREGILRLAARIGYLRGTVHEYVPLGHSNPTRRGEPFALWLDTVERVSALVDLLDIFRARDRTALDDRFRWMTLNEPEKPSMLIWHGPGPWSRWLDRVALIPSGPWMLDPDNETKERWDALRFMELHATWNRDPFALAWRILAERVNVGVAGGVRTALSLNLPKRGKRSGAIISPLPLQQAYVQILREASGEAIFRRCSGCAWWFEATGRRADIEYCTPSCRTQASRRRGEVPPRWCALPDCQQVLTGIGQQRYCTPSHARPSLPR